MVGRPATIGGKSGWRPGKPVTARQRSGPRAEHNGARGRRIRPTTTRSNQLGARARLVCEGSAPAPAANCPGL
jgi:hypothetical protein